jgi:hypothetical protein
VQQLVFGAGLENERITVLAERENLSIRSPRRSRESGRNLRTNALLVVNFLARARVLAAQKTEVTRT